MQPQTSPKSAWRPAVRALIALAVLISLAGCSPLGTKGTMPPPGPDGQVDPSAAPDFIVVAAREGAGIAGYVRKEAVFPGPTTTVGRPVEPTWPVYGEDLRTLVGHLVPGIGFVPLGVDPASVPTFRVEVGPSMASGAAQSGQVTLYVKNDSAITRWFDVLGVGPPAGGSGYWGGAIGAGCYPMPAGSRLAELDRASWEPGATVVRVLYLRGQEAVAPSLWIEIAANGQATQGRGVPDWWSGGALTC